MIQFTDELNNHLVDTAAKRAAGENLTKKQTLRDQHEFILGAISAIDFLNGQIGIENGKSCIPPHVYVSILRSELIEKIS